MSERPSQIPFLFALLAVALAAAALAVSLVNLSGLNSQSIFTTTCTTTITQTTTRTTTVTTTRTTEPGTPSVTIVSSEGSCGTLDQPTLSFERDGEDVILRYSEQAGVPCYGHIIAESVVLERFPPIIVVTLELESTSDVCVECVGVIETILRVDSVPEGTEIVVNGLQVTV